jgi:kynureninase
MPEIVEHTLAYAQQQDREDELQSFRSRFYFPHRPSTADQPSRQAPFTTGEPASNTPRPPASDPGEPLIYFCGNSLGLQPREAQEAIRQELADWRDLAIDGYWKARKPWMTYPQAMSGPLSRLAGCQEDEVTVMNALTVNLHLLLLTFYRPAPKRYKILIEAGAFPSDQYAVETQVRWHGRSPREAIVEVGPRQGEKLIREEDILAAIDREKDSLALVLLGGVNYYTGQLFDMAAIAAAAHKAGALVGFDLAHAIGNTPLSLHDWGADFAVWCSYKYLNGGPGAAGGAFVHERWAKDASLLRLGGWWGNDEMARFQTDHNSLPTARAAANSQDTPAGATPGATRGFIPKPTAEGWSMSTAQIFNMVCLRASLGLFEEAGFEKLQAKSRALTSYLYTLVSTAGIDILTPAKPERRGAQLSLYVGDKGRSIQQQLAEAGIVVDYREPGVIRVSPAPLYNSFEDVYRFSHILGQLS